MRAEYGPSSRATGPRVIVEIAAASWSDTSSAPAAEYRPPPVPAASSSSEPSAPPQIETP